MYGMRLFGTSVTRRAVAACLYCCSFAPSSRVFAARRQFCVANTAAAFLVHSRPAPTRQLHLDGNRLVASASTAASGSQTIAGGDAGRGKKVEAPPPPRPIVGYHTDDEDHWVAQLGCGHFQHVRHDPPMIERPWVLTEEGRASFLGYELSCKKCGAGAPKDSR